MESKGYILGISRELSTNRYTLTIALEGANRSEIESLDNSHPYRLKLSKWSDKRSLDSNAYLWQLVTKIADAVKSSKEEVYEELLRKYGLVDEEVVITVKSTVDMSRIEGHWLKIKDNGTWSGYIRIRGSSEYDRREMANFLDRVVEDAKEIGVETLTPTELERLKEACGREGS
jgi:hypothetical protein